MHTERETASDLPRHAFAPECVAALADLGLSDEEIARYHRMPTQAVARLRRAAAKPKGPVEPLRTPLGPKFRD